jgi:hypothetical protein
LGYTQFVSDSILLEELKSKLSFGGAAFLSFQISPYLGIQTELIYIVDKIDARETNIIYDGITTNQDFNRNKSESYNEILEIPSLMLPILAKAGYRGSKVSVFGIGGIYFNIPLIKEVTLEPFYWLDPITVEIKPPLMGFMVGGIFGFKAGPGSIFIDARFAMDFGKVERPLNGSSQTEYIYGRKNILFSLGYEFGVIDRK